MKALKGCVDHVERRRMAGDNRALDDVITEAIRLFSTQQKTDILHAEVKRNFQQGLRKKCLEISRPEDELTEQLPFESKDLSYRCGPLVRVNRAGEVDALRPHLVTGKDIERHDSWDVGQSKRRVAYAQDRQRHNKHVSLGLKPFGLDPNRQTIADMQSEIDQRICVLCGEGFAAGDPWEHDHETPAATQAGTSAAGGAHRSCNRSKGKLPIDHQHSAVK